MRSNNISYRALLCSILLLSCSSFGLAEEVQKGLCTAEERVEFSCPIKSKIVSLCSSGDLGTLTSLTYRYGVPGKVENEFVARRDNSNRFYAAYSPANPGAQVIQVWFDRGSVRYLLIQCVGGNCPQNAGLVVLRIRGNKVLMNEKCPDYTRSDHGWFSKDLIAFGKSGDARTPDNMRSTTELLQIDQQTANDIDRIFK